ncbi:MAG: hypothetical protein ACREMQ_11815, partial [Longimicrobiales bacterium]
IVDRTGPALDRAALDAAGRIAARTGLEITVSAADESPAASAAAQPDDLLIVALPADLDSTSLDPRYQRHASLLALRRWPKGTSPS